MSDCSTLPEDHCAHDHAALGRRAPERTVVSYVRRSDRLSPRLQRAWDAHRASFLLDVVDRDRSVDLKPGLRFDAAAVERFWGNAHPLVVEVGSGQGENVVAAAARNPDLNMLAVEVYTPGLAHTMLLAARLGLANLRLAQVNAPELLAAVQPGLLRELWTFFPDPWPKMRHHKRRIVQVPFAALVRRSLEPGGLWRLATDIEDYALQMHQVLDGMPGLRNVGDRQVALPTEHVGKGTACQAPSLPHALFTESRRFEGRVVTKFEHKGLDAGRTIHDLTYRAV